MSAPRPSYLRSVPNPNAPPVTSVVVPPLLETRLAGVVALFARETGEDLESVRRVVELAALTRGIESLEKELKKK